MSSAIRPSASLYSEPKTIANRLDLWSHPSRRSDRPFLAQSGQSLSYWTGESRGHKSSGRPRRRSL